jgi:hypothetical protein
LAFTTPSDGGILARATAMGQPEPPLILKPGDVIVIGPGVNRRGSSSLRSAVEGSCVPLYALERFSLLAAAVVASDPAKTKGMTRQARDAGLPILSEQQALDAIGLLNSPLEPGWCECAEPLAPRLKARSWEAHQFGICGWPERRCDQPEHRRSWCRTCRRVVRVRFCTCGAPSEFVHDQRRDWWVHTACGWPTRAWYSGLASRKPNTPECVDGAPSWVFRIHQARGQAELELRALSDDVRAIDVAWAGRGVED